MFFRERSASRNILNTTKSILPTCYRFIRTTVRIVSSHEIITTILLLQSSLVAVVSKDVTRSRYNQSPLPNSDAIFKNTCVQVEELNLYYNINSNVASLADVSYFLFAEDHHIPQHKSLMSDFIAKLASPGDIFLTEGFPRNEELHCSTLGSYANNPHKGSGVTKKQYSQPPALPPGHLFVPLNISNELVCYGWESKSFDHKISEKWLKIYNEKTKFFSFDDQPGMAIPNKVMTALNIAVKATNVAKQIPILKELVRDFDELFKMSKFKKYIAPDISATLKAFKQLQKDVAAIKDNSIKLDSYFKIIRNFQVIGTAVITQVNRYIAQVNKEAMQTQVAFRNKGAINTFNFFKNNSATKFARLGRNHLLGNEQTNIFTPNHVFNQKKPEPESALIESLQNKAYAILVPKR